LAVKLDIQVRPVNSSSVPAYEPSVKNIQVLDEKSADLLLATAKTLKSSDLAEAIKKLSERHREEKK
jgi:glutamate racemase